VAQDEHPYVTIIGKNRKDPVLVDVWPYCSDPQFIEHELRRARSTEDPIRYVEGRIVEEIGDRKGDLRILLNRLTKKVDGKITV
jgi:hypothetical protein